jgi:hypothetical protein
MPAKKDRLTPIQAKMKKVGKRLEAEGRFSSDAEIEAWQSQRVKQVISSAVSEVKDHISKQPMGHEQMLFSFMPTQMTRTTPFYPMGKREMRDRPVETLEWETSWGRITRENYVCYDGLPYDYEAVRDRAFSNLPRNESGVSVGVMPTSGPEGWPMSERILRRDLFLFQAQSLSLSPVSTP